MVRSSLIVSPLGGGGMGIVLMLRRYACMKTKTTGPKMSLVHEMTRRGENKGKESVTSIVALSSRPRVFDRRLA